MNSKRMFKKAVSDFSYAVYIQIEMCNAFNLFIVISTFPVSRLHYLRRLPFGVLLEHIEVRDE